MCFINFGIDNNVTLKLRIYFFFKYFYFFKTTYFTDQYFLYNYFAGFPGKFTTYLLRRWRHQFRLWSYFSCGCVCLWANTCMCRFWLFCIFITDRLVTKGCCHLFTKNPFQMQKDYLIRPPHSYNVILRCKTLYDTSTFNNWNQLDYFNIFIRLNLNKTLPMQIWHLCMTLHFSLQCVKYRLTVTTNRAKLHGELIQQFKAQGPFQNQTELLTDSKHFCNSFLSEQT